MLAVAASDVLVIAEHSTLKYPPLILLPSCRPAEKHNTSAWAADNSTLYLASSHTISRYDLSSKQLVALYTPDDGYIQCLAVKDKSTIIYGAQCNIYVLECGGQKPIVAQSFGPYKHDILSLSLSNDTTLLACGLSNAAYVQNLTTGSQTTLRGLPSKSSITICTFHPHVRTRLLVGSGDQLLMYDTTQPSTPIKIIPMNDAGICIQAIACSPFSKTLVAVAMSDGGVGLIDLDKEKGLFRTLHLNVPLTTISFSPEGGSIYLGTENGKLLVQDLRTLNKPPRSIIVSESGNPINTLTVQKKLKESPQNVKGDRTPKALGKSMSTPISRTTFSPLRSRVARTSSSSATTPIRRTTITVGTPKHSAMSRGIGSKKVLMPTRDPHKNSPHLETKESIKVKKACPLETASILSKHGFSPAKSSLSLGATGRTNSCANRRKTPPAMVDALIATRSENMSTEEFSSVSNVRSRSRSRNTFSISEPASSLMTAVSRSPRLVSSSSASASTQCRPSSTPLVPLISSVANLRPVSPISESDDKSRTPSPDLPEMKTDLSTPIPAQKKKKAMAVLGLGTPEDNARVRSVGFKHDTNHVRDDGEDHPGENDSHEDQLWERERSLSLQISPCRPPPASYLSQDHGHEPGPTWDASPMIRSRQAANTPGTPSSGSAHELLRTIVKDVMFDFQRETRAEMMGLHLDLVRMGRGWKRELRTLMDEYVGNLNDLKEENRRLKEENDRLRGH